MVQKRIFWTTGECSYFFYCPIISYQMKGLKQWLWEYYDGTMVSVENSIPVSTTVIIVQGKIFW